MPSGYYPAPTATYLTPEEEQLLAEQQMQQEAAAQQAPAPAPTPIQGSEYDVYADPSQVPAAAAPAPAPAPAPVQSPEQMYGTTAGTAAPPPTQYTPPGAAESPASYNQQPATTQASESTAPDYVSGGGGQGWGELIGAPTPAGASTPLAIPPQAPVPQGQSFGGALGTPSPAAVGGAPAVYPSGSSQPPIRSRTDVASTPMGQNDTITGYDAGYGGSIGQRDGYGVYDDTFFTPTDPGYNESGLRDVLNGLRQRNDAVSEHINNAGGNLIRDTWVEPTGYSFTDFMGRMAGLDPTGRNGNDMRHQLSGNLWDYAGDTLLEMWNDATSETQATDPLMTLATGAKNLATPPLQLAQHLAGPVKDFLWQATEDTVGPEGVGLRQIESTKKHVAPIMEQIQKEQGSAWNRGSQGAAAMRRGATGPVEATAATLNSINSGIQGVTGRGFGENIDLAGGEASGRFLGATAPIAEAAAPYVAAAEPLINQSRARTDPYVQQVQDVVSPYLDRARQGATNVGTSVWGRIPADTQQNLVGLLPDQARAKLAGRAIANNLPQIPGNPMDFLRGSAPSFSTDGLPTPPQFSPPTMEQAAQGGESILDQAGKMISDLPGLIPSSPPVMPQLPGSLEEAQSMASGLIPDQLPGMPSLPPQLQKGLDGARALLPQTTPAPIQGVMDSAQSLFPQEAPDQVKSALGLASRFIPKDVLTSVEEIRKNAPALPSMQSVTSGIQTIPERAQSVVGQVTGMTPEGVSKINEAPARTQTTTPRSNPESKKTVESPSAGKSVTFDVVPAADGIGVQSTKDGSDRTWMEDMLDGQAKVTTEYKAPVPGQVWQDGHGADVNTHAGYDIGLEGGGVEGTPVKSPISGTVVCAGYGQGTGDSLGGCTYSEKSTSPNADGSPTAHTVVIEVGKDENGNPIQLSFNHVGTTDLKPGQQINVGDVLGTMGNTPGGPHIHLEGWVGDPESGYTLQDPQLIVGGHFGGSSAAPSVNSAEPSSLPMGEMRSSPGVTPGDPAPYQSLVQQAASDNDVPPEILSALLGQESRYDPSALSPAGAIGIAQFMPDTAEGYGIDPLDPSQAIPAAAEYLADAYEQFGSWELALAAYNAGGGAVEQYGGIPPFPETQNYVKSVMDASKEVSFEETPSSPAAKTAPASSNVASKGSVPTLEEWASRKVVGTARGPNVPETTPPLNPTQTSAPWGQSLANLETATALASTGNVGEGGLIQGGLLTKLENFEYVKDGLWTDKAVTDGAANPGAAGKPASVREANLDPSFDPENAKPPATSDAPKTTSTGANAPIASSPATGVVSETSTGGGSNYVPSSGGGRSWGNGRSSGSSWNSSPTSGGFDFDSFFGGFGGGDEPEDIESWLSQAGGDRKKAAKLAKAARLRNKGKRMSGKKGSASTFAMSPIRANTLANLDAAFSKAFKR